VIRNASLLTLSRTAASTSAGITSNAADLGDDARQHTGDDVQHEQDTDRWKDGAGGDDELPDDGCATRGLKSDASGMTPISRKITFVRRRRRRQRL
jgi:hypothetical protein